MRSLILTTLLTLTALFAAAEEATAQPVATKTMGAWNVEVFIPKPPEAGKALDVDLALKPAATAPKAVRLWIGAANAKGSVKVKAEPEAAGAYCVGVEVPDPIPADAKLWITIEADDGTVSKESVDLPSK
jgi:hypothetical protein